MTEQVEVKVVFKFNGGEELMKRWEPEEPDLGVQLQSQNWEVGTATLPQKRINNILDCVSIRRSKEVKTGSEGLKKI